MHKLDPEIHTGGQRGGRADRHREPGRPQRRQSGRRARRAHLVGLLEARAHQRDLAPALDQHRLHNRSRRNLSGRTGRGGCRQRPEDAPGQLDAEREHHAQRLLRIVGGRVRLIGQGQRFLPQPGRALPVQIQYLAHSITQRAERILLCQ
ncbi:hypothetical protein K8O92_10245 [Nocardia asteroides]|nr:hypothetical protein K8O92_10245 [Nocardia asteroides]